MDKLEPQAESYWEFLLAIPWKEPWMVCLMLSHFAILLTIILTRNYHNIQYGLFFTLLLLVYLSETLNTWASENWKLFTKEQYFDSNGLFISTVWSTPMLINCLIMIVLWLYSISKSLILVKRKQIERQIVNNQANEGAQESENDSTIDEEDKKEK